MQDLIKAFMPKFVASAQKRVARSLELAAKHPADVVGVARELHAIAGEAGLLGIAHVVKLARAGEDHAKRMRSTATDADVESLVATLNELHHAVEAVSQHQKGSHE